ncbi:YciI family protein [Agarivorans sp. MS3-6]|uniref:YciI family protein n=1 Tax=Agarivorans sp. TSD2052 TaxID=2937286 RepID=UPI0020104BDC|nr:YciI family protein [Agarivorans sp. TSD2052]UPW19630.1 YciI family protein [Agarivorans sp. TSD2052]
MSNKQYMCLLRSSSGGCEKPSPADMELMFAKYQAWQEQFADNILDMGSKLGASGAVVQQDSLKDGPFMEVKEIIGGYMTLSAESLEQAIAVIQASPMVGNEGTSIEIREICRL